MPDQFGNPQPGDPDYMGPNSNDLAREKGAWVADPLNIGGGGVRNGKDPNSVGQYVDNSLANAGDSVGNFWNSINGAYHPGQVSVGDAGQGAVNRGDSNSNQTRGMQMSLIQQLQDQANGTGPSLAQMQLQRGTDQNLANAMALGQSQRGAGQAGMLKGIQSQQAQIGQGMAGDAAMLRLNEQLQARNQLGQQVSAVRGADDQNAQFYAGQQNSTANANAQRQADAARAQAQLELERQKMLQQESKDKSPIGMIGGLLSAISDCELKTDITPGEHKLYDFLDKLGSHEYRYKDAKHGEGRRISPMAQELESSEAGKPFVFETKDGKAVDYGKGFGTMLAAQAALHKRLKALEGR